MNRLAPNFHFLLFFRPEECTQRYHLYESVFADARPLDWIRRSICDGDSLLPYCIYKQNDAVPIVRLWCGGHGCRNETDSHESTEEGIVCLSMIKRNKIIHFLIFDDPLFRAYPYGGRIWKASQECHRDSIMICTFTSLVLYCN